MDAVKAYCALLGILSLGLIPGFTQVKLSEIPYFIGLGSMAIYIGSHKSLTAKTRQQLTFKEAGYPYTYLILFKLFNA